MNKQLKPCPFCGNATAPRLWTTEELYEGMDLDSFVLSESVVCDVNGKPHAGCGSSVGFKPTKADAISAWNTRTESA